MDRVEEAQKLWEESRKIAWSRTQTAYALEAATLGGAYTVWKDGHSFLAILILMLGVSFMFGLFLVMRRDVQHGKAFREFLEAQGKMFTFAPHLFGIKTNSLVPCVPAILLFVNFALSIATWVCR